jgi:hypothetical protein
VTEGCKHDDNAERCWYCHSCCNKHADYCNQQALDLERIKEAWFTGDPDNVEDILIELFGDIPLK